MRRFLPLALASLLIGCTASATGTVTPGASASPGASAAPSAAPSGATAATGVTFTTDGRAYEDSGVCTAYKRGDTNLELQFGQAPGRLPGEAIMALQVTVDKAKMATGTYGTEAVTQISALLRVIKNPVPYTFEWKPALQGDPITFSMSVADGKVTAKWAGKMSRRGADETTIVAECKDVPLR